MKKIILDAEDGTVNLSIVTEGTPIFAKDDDKLIGMIVKDDNGWVLRIGGSSGATGYHKTLKECIVSCLRYDYEFFIA